jgi:hypothetical protein
MIEAVEAELMASCVADPTRAGGLPHLSRRKRGERPEEAINALDEAVVSHGDDVEADQDQMLSFAELPVVTESIVVLIDPRRGHEACVGVLGAKFPDIRFQSVVTNVEVDWVAELKVGRHGLLEVAPDLGGIGFVPHGEVVIARRKWK